ncbi:protein EARLY FLOWERING 3-like [Camellia sinensis]|uniref:protein EARLY FLOWERING 3-like n=1 Tax=Camellia sinensis TaxID=4442 RepID=UPI001036CA80|nr:protein EARLY FLOWERING 3-like [Camellia sinensis]
MFFPPHLQRSTHPAGKSYAGYSDFNSPLTPLEHDEEDFMVPIFVQLEIGQDQRKNSNGIDREDDEPVRGIENGHSSILSRDSCLEELGSPNNPTFESGYHEDNRCESLQIAKGDREDDASETSMVDSIPGLDMSPDDVVGIIGQKQFWKARRAIVNQQRVFAVQVFELHRLIKCFLGKPLKGSSPKKLPIENVVKPSPHIVKHKDDSRNPNRKMECLAENGVRKTFCSSEQNFSQPSNYRLFSEQGVSPWGFHQSPGHQWLVLVMSPSEGLIYKPYYPGHGLLGPVCRGCGHPGSNPMMGISGSLHQNSCNVPTQKSGAISNDVKQPASSESEFLGSTASSSGERAQEFGSKRRNVLTLFPTSPIPVVHFAEGSAELQDTCQPTRVIKVVPRNARSATESTARIFQSIQEERKQCDSF